MECKKPFIPDNVIHKSNCINIYLQEFRQYKCVENVI